MQPDIEIYLKDASKEQVQDWLSRVFSHCSNWQGKGSLYHCLCDGIPVIWYARAVGSWHSLLFDSANTPWADDLACAAAACAALGVEVRCAPGGWQEEDGEAGADLWIKVTGHGSEEFVWRS